MKRINPNIYNNKIEEILKALVEDLKTIITANGGKIQIYNRDNQSNRLTIGSYKDCIIDNIYIDNTDIMIKLISWEYYEIPMDCDFNTCHFNVGEMSYDDYLNIYKMVAKILND